MLRQSEEEPEDPMGEILISVGLASREDIYPSPHSSDTSRSPSAEPNDCEVS